MSSSSSSAPSAAEQFAMGELVWAKMDAHCPWPAQIVHPQGDFASKQTRKRRQSHDQHLVFFFGDHTFAWHPSAVRLMRFEPNFSTLSKRSKSKTFLIALREAAREKARLAREGEQFGYRVIADDALSDSSETSSSASVSSSLDADAANAAAAASTAKRRRHTSSASRARGRKRPATSSRRKSAANAGDQAAASSVSSASSLSSSSSSDSVPYTTLPEENELSAQLRGGNAPLETGAAQWAATRLQMSIDSEEWAVVLVLLARLAGMSATLDALRISGVGKQVKRASKAPHAATASRASQLMERWAALVRNTLKQSTDVISHTGQSAEGVENPQSTSSGNEK